MSETTHGADVRSISQKWPKAAIALGIGLTAAWICCLGYGLLKLIGITFS